MAAGTRERDQRPRSARTSRAARDEDQRGQDIPGRDADKPTEIPKRGWFAIAKRAWKEGSKDQVPLLAAGIAYYAFLAIFPAFIAAVSIYGLVAQPAEVTRQVNDLASALPADAREVLTGQLQQLAGASSGALSFSLLVSIALALFSASGGVANLMQAINTCYDEEETRGFIKKRGTALLLTLGAIVFMVVAVFTITVLPAVFDALGLSGIGLFLVQVLRWVGLVVAVMVALAVLYRVAPDRDAPKFAWVSTGAIIATVLWIVASIGFAFYANNFGSYNKTYGALAGVVVLLFWLWITSYIVLLGAEINAEAEAQTAKDTTVGPEQPEGQRGAVKADTPPEEVSPRS